MANAAPTARRSGRSLLPKDMPARRFRWNAHRLTVLRQAAGLSPERVAVLVNEHLPKSAKISGNKVRRWAAGLYFPDVRELEALCMVFNCDVGVFFKADND
jgi:transcriptional regulator with XRE-family HTH domain